MELQKYENTYNIIIDTVMTFFTNLLVFDRIEATRSCQYIAWIFSIVAVSTVAGFIPFPVSLYYLPICGICLLYVLSGGVKKVKGMYVVLFVAFGLSALFAEEPMFNSKLRFSLFVMVSMICSPCIMSDRAVTFRTLITRNILALLSLLTVGSFFCYFLGINYMRTTANELHDLSSAGIFGGLYLHSMLLGPCSVLVAMVFLNSFMVERKKLFILLFFISVAAVILSASRASTLALGAPIAYSLFFMKDWGGSRKKLIGLLIVVFILGAPMAEKIGGGLIEKQQRNVEMGGTLSSREGKWDARIEEFRNYPITGIGFCAVDTKNTDDYNSYGGVEPGSTHLSVLSMTGILGFIPYIMVLWAAYKAVRRDESVKAKIRMCLFLAMITHATFEGYGLSAGGFLFLMFWLVIAQCEDYNIMKSKV